MRCIYNKNYSSSSMFQHGIRTNLRFRSFLGAWVLHSFPIHLYRTMVLPRLPFGIMQLDVAHHNLGCITHRRYYRRSLGCPSDERRRFLVNTDPSWTLLNVFDGSIVNKVAFLVLFSEFWFTLEFLRPTGRRERQRKELPQRQDDSVSAWLNDTSFITKQHVIQKGFQVCHSLC